jgi:uncharacterized membrane-anchored protein YitT (DUF2179 family)
VKELFSKKELGRTLGAVLGTLLFAAAINIFVVPVGVYSDGIIGICQVIRTILIKYLHMNFNGYDIAGIIYYMVNIPLFFMAFRSIGKVFFVKTMICTIAMTLFLTVIPIPNHLLVKNDILTTVIFGGIISGIGNGLTLIMGGSTGGIEIIAVYFIKKRRRVGVGQVALGVNLVLYVACFVLFDITTTIYSLIVAIASSVAIDRLHSQNINVEATIISKTDLKPFQTEFMSLMGRGITKWRITGAYTNMDAEALYIILSKYEVGQLRQLVRKYDPEAFVVINEGVTVYGNFDKKL